MGVVGPGAIQENKVNPGATLDSASEYEYVTIFNPLSDDFAIRVGMDVPVNMPFELQKDMTGKTTAVTNTEADARQVYGLSLKNPDFQGRKHVYNDTVIKAGGTINLKGNEAQVAVRQLVNEILQREGKTRLQSDPVLRKEVEDRIIVKRGSIQELMDSNFSTPSQQINEAINRSNEVSNDSAFPGLSEAGAEEAPAANGSFADAENAPVKRSPGRPAKAA